MQRRFVRADTFRHKKIGKNRPKLQKWRRPRGKHNKLRLKRFGHPAQPGIGYGRPKELRGTVAGKLPRLVHNVHELTRMNKGEIAVLARVGAKKRMELLKKATELNIEVIGGRPA